MVLKLEQYESINGELNANNYLPTDYQNFIALSRYARWKDDEQRRENWGKLCLDTLTTWIITFVTNKLTISHKDMRNELELADNELRCHA
jgi:hypothetical protein